MYVWISFHWDQIHVFDWLYIFCSLLSLSFMTQRHPSIHLLDSYHQPKLINVGYADVHWAPICGFDELHSFWCFRLIFQIVDAIISHGCFLRECTVQHSVVGERSRLDYGVELKVTHHLFFHSLHFLFPFWLLEWVITISLFSVFRIPWCLGQTTTKLKLKLPLFWQRVKSQLA